VYLYTSLWEIFFLIEWR